MLNYSYRLSGFSKKSSQIESHLVTYAKSSRPLHLNVRNSWCYCLVLFFFFFLLFVYLYWCLCPGLCYVHMLWLTCLLLLCRYCNSLQYLCLTEPGIRYFFNKLFKLVITPENFMMIRWWEHSQKGVTDRQTDGRTENTVHRAAWSQKGVTDRQTDGQTENTICRAAWSQLKTIGYLFYATTSFVHHFVAISEFKLELRSGNVKTGAKFVLTFVTLTFDLLHGHHFCRWW